MKQRRSAKQDLAPGALVRRGRREDPGPKEIQVNLAATEAAFARASAGHAQAWDELLALLASFRHSLIRSLRFWLKAKWQDAEDAVSDLFVTLVEEAREGSLKKPYRGRWWAGLYSRAERRWRMNLVRAQRQTPLLKSEPDSDEFLESQVIANDPMAEGLEFEDEIAGLIRRAGEKVNLRQRRIFYARLRGLPYSQIAEFLHTTKGTARVEHSNARRALQAEMLKTTPEAARTRRRQGRRKSRKVA